MRIGDWIFDHFGWVVAGVLAFCVFGLVVAVRADTRAREAFMEQCTADHKEYECVALWRAGERRTQVMPMPVIIR